MKERQTDRQTDRHRQRDRGDSIKQHMKIIKYYESVDSDRWTNNYRIN